MSIRQQRGDLFEATTRALAHGCNCAGAMGRGIAVEFRRRWPDMFDRYRQLCLSGRFNPGDLFVWTTGERVIYNLATQKHWRSRASSKAIAISAAKMVGHARRHGVQSIAMPRIGTGLGGLKWPEVRRILDDAIPDDIVANVYYSPTS